jgi:hypothetical protein
MLLLFFFLLSFYHTQKEGADVAAPSLTGGYYLIAYRFLNTSWA